MNEPLINQAIENFRKVLIDGFSAVASAYQIYKVEAENRENDYPVEFEDFFIDWAQCSWELLVERVVCTPSERLVPYGGGSDYEANEHSHVFFKGAKESHEVICQSLEAPVDVLSGSIVDLDNYQFMEFVALEESWFKVSPPFDYVLFNEIGVFGSAYKQVVVLRSSLKFSVSAYET